MRQFMFVLVTTALLAGPVSAQTNLLQNPEFTEPVTYTDNCQLDINDAVTGWDNLSLRNGSIFKDDFCSATPGDYNYGPRATMQAQGTKGIMEFTQTVTGLTASTAHELTGWWIVGHGGTVGRTKGIAELYDGADPSSDPLLASTELSQTSQAQTPWTQFTVTGTPTGDTMTVRFVMDYDSYWQSVFHAVHVDSVSLLGESTCLNPPTVTGITPAYGEKNDTLVPVSIQGTNFVDGETIVRLTRTGQPDIEVPAENVTWTDAGNIGCNLDLTGAVNGRWNLEVEVTTEGCPPAFAGGAFLVVMPAFSNGSFEFPTPPVDPPTGCGLGALVGFPDDWLVAERRGYGYENMLLRNSDRDQPSCPAPEGDHYASTLSDDAGGDSAEAEVYQTFTVSPSTVYTVTGSFAGGGNNVVKLALLEGDESADAIDGATTTVHNPGGPYDWTYAFASGTTLASQNLMTVRWQVQLMGPGPHSSHADNLQVLICDTPITLETVAPTLELNDGVKSLTITGTGFDAGTPNVALMRSGASIAATDVVVDTGSAGTILTCNVDLTGQTSGYYDVVVQQGGCVEKLTNAFLIVTTELLNGEFEDAPAAQNCGTLVPGASGWQHTSYDWWRDHNIHMPTCPRDVPAPEPGEDNGHYQSITHDTEQGAIDKAWQTVQVAPGVLYRFSGWFAGGGANDVTLRLLEGDINGTEIASTVVYSCSEACGAYDWTYAEVEGAASGDKMTVVWEMITNDENLSASHADGMALDVACNDPFADFDNDGDVDQEDFAAFQICFTGNPDGGATIAPGCECFDRAFSGAIDQDDLNLFEACASGPDIPVDPCCDGGCP